MFKRLSSSYYYKKLKGFGFQICLKSSWVLAKAYPVARWQLHPCVRERLIKAPRTALSLSPPHDWNAWLKGNHPRDLAAALYVCVIHSYRFNRNERASEIISSRTPPPVCSGLFFYHEPIEEAPDEKRYVRITNKSFPLSFFWQSSRSSRELAGR